MKKTSLKGTTELSKKEERNFATSYQEREVSGRAIKKQSRSFIIRRCCPSEVFAVPFTISVICPCTPGLGSSLVPVHHHQLPMNYRLPGSGKDNEINSIRQIANRYLFGIAYQVVKTSASHRDASLIEELPGKSS